MTNSESFAGVGVTNRRYEEAQAEGQHEDVQHGMLLCGVMCGRRRNRPLGYTVKCHPAHRFSRRE